MTTEPSPRHARRAYPALERLTAAVLLLVLAALVWMVLAAWQPGWADWAPLGVQVWLILALLVAALLLVSAVALLHTRS